MKLERLQKITNKLFFRVYLYFGIILSVFAILIGLIYMKLYENSTMETFKDELQAKADNIATLTSKYIRSNSLEDYSVYIDVLSKTETCDVWILSNPNAANPMDSIYENVNTDINLEHINQVLNAAFDNRKEINTSYNDIYQVVLMTLGTPIYDGGGNVIGAVILNAQVKTQADIISRSKELIFYSAFVALAISFVIAILFARSLSNPVSKMRTTALELAKGNYKIHTDIRQKDEIGELATTLDILSEKLQENEIERNYLEQMRLDFFANVSHELRTPITVIRAYTETLVDGIVTEPVKVSQYYDRMLLECKSMERLVGDLLTLSKMQNPDFTVDTEPINLVQVFDDLLRSAHAIGGEKNIKFDFVYDKECCMMLGDYDRIRQMFLVILDNAIKFSNPHQTIYISIKSDDKLKISIRDEGIGISPEDIGNIFDKFYKSKLRQNAKGSGLGLAIARQIALKHGGTISVESEVNKGTCFTFEFDTIDDNEWC